MIPTLDARRRQWRSVFYAADGINYPCHAFRLSPSPRIESRSVDMVTKKHITSVKPAHYDLVLRSREPVAVTSTNCPVEISQSEILDLPLKTNKTTCTAQLLECEQSDATAITKY
jgi:hypothetical protein